MQIFTKLLFYVSLSCFTFKVSLAQDTTESSNLYIGLNLSKTLLKQSYKLGGSYVIEPKLWYYFKDGFALGFEAGYSHLRHKDRENARIRNYQNKGFYFKFGPYIGSKSFDDKKWFANLGFMLTYSSFQEKGTFYISSQYFGDYTENFERKGIRTTGIEGNLNYWLQITKQFYLKLSTRLNITNYPNIDTGNRDLDILPVYYIPGIGFDRNPDDKNTWTYQNEVERRTFWMIGFSVDLFFKI